MTPACSRCRNKPVADHVFETVSSETVYRGKILALRTDEVRMPGGGTAMREVVEHLGKAAGREAYDHMNARRAAA